MARRDGVVLAEVDVMELPEQSEISDASEIVDEEHGKLGIATLVISDAQIYAAVLEARVSKKSGTALAAFDLRKRAWIWHQGDGCAVNEAIQQR